MVGFWIGWHKRMDFINGKGQFSFWVANRLLADGPIVEATSDFKEEIILQILGTQGVEVNDVDRRFSGRTRGGHRVKVQRRPQRKQEMVDAGFLATKTSGKFVSARIRDEVGDA